MLRGMQCEKMTASGTASVRRSEHFLYHMVNETEQKDK